LNDLDLTISERCAIAVEVKNNIMPNFKSF